MISKNIEKYFNYSFFYTPSVFAEENLNVSDGMGYVYSRSFLIDRASFRNNLVMLVLDGTLYVEQYGQRHELHSGEFIVMKLSDKHRYYSDKNDTARIFWFHFRGRGCDELMTQAGRYKKLPVLQKDSDNALLSMITDMFEVTKTQADGFEADVSPLIYNAVSHALSQTVKEMLFSPNTPADEIIHKVRSYADDHICESLTLDILSAAAGVNKYYLCRVFKENSEFLRWRTSPEKRWSCQKRCLRTR